MRYMPAKAPPIASPAAEQLARLGLRIRTQRKGLGLSAVLVAKAATMSRVTLHRIEAGEPSVAMGAYLNAISALGLTLEASASSIASAPAAESVADGMPLEIKLADYPELKRLAWHARGLKALTLEEAFNLYERNARHLETQRMGTSERTLLQALIKKFGKGHLLV